MSSVESLPVSFSTKSVNGDRYIGVVTLDKLSALNALGLDMIRLITPKLVEWRNDDNVVAVVLRGQGDKAFCAGGDVVSMHTAMVNSPRKTPEMLFNFFSEEYRLDYMIHTYNKPFVVWANGIVMGGGMGLMNGASHRIVTESSRIAMPEITIGLFPDVGGTWFLPKMPGKTGLFFGLTGASINATDALYVGLAEAFIAHENYENFLSQLASLDWSVSSVEAQKEQVTALCQQMQSADSEMMPSNNVESHRATIDDLMTGSSIVQVIANFEKADFSDDKWLSRAKKSLINGSPITAHIVFEQLERGQSLTLEECFKLEFNVACRGSELGEFQEGVRALLIDKDNAPNWQYKTVQDVPEEVIESFFASQWPEDDHPMANLTISE
ncbi:enoyl-CoA hydratase/isomerase family protein [Alteromonadaceae bacterium M269]|nr:enoyl-CoA hydratase/isomerase family protein [Alteromonadaceae bacterium M269]